MVNRPGASRTISIGSFPLRHRKSWQTLALCLHPLTLLKSRGQHMEKSLNWHEFIITRLIKASGYSAIIFVALIFFFLVREGVPTFAETSLSSLLSIRWYPIEDHFGILPLITGSLMVTIGAALVAVPFGLGTAVY